MNDLIQYEIRYLGKPYYCILWISIGQNIFVMRSNDDKAYKAVMQHENGERFSTIKELYWYVHDMCR